MDNESFLYFGCFLHMRKVVCEFLSARRTFSSIVQSAKIIVKLHLASESCILNLHKALELVPCR